MMLSEVAKTLERSGFETFSVNKVKSTCFNLLAVRDLNILFIKVLMNIDSISKEHARDIRRISNFFNGIPLIIGKKNRRGELGPGVVYEKTEVKSMSLETFKNLFEGEKPIAYSDKGGLYVSIDGEELEKARKEKNMTLGGLANLVGVSRSTIYKYEKNDQDATLNKAVKLKEILGSPSILKPINPLDRREDQEVKEEPEKNSKGENKLQIDVFSKLDNLGLLVTQIHKAPFEALSKKDSFTFLTGVNKIESPVVDKKAKIVSHITNATESEAMFVVEKKKKERVEHVPFFNKEDLDEIKDIDELKEEIEEKRHQPKET